MTTNREWLFSKPFDEQVVWMNAEHQDGTLDDDTAALNAKIAELTAERDELTSAVNELQKKQPYCYDPGAPLDTLNTIGRYIDELTAERDYYRMKFGKCLDYADAIHALMDEGIA